MNKRIWNSNTHENEKGFFVMFSDLCKGCGLCIEKCPTQVIQWSEELGFMGTPAVKPKMDGCIVCGMCETVCPDTAIRIERKNKKPTPAQVV